MKLFLIIGDVRICAPDFVAAFLRGTKDPIAGAAVVTHAPPSVDMQRYLLRHLQCLKPAEVAALGLRAARAGVLDAIRTPGKEGPFYSVTAVLRAFGVDFHLIRRDINEGEYVQAIRAAAPDLIVSISNPVLLREELLTLAPLGCLNCHCSLLPAYGGLWPPFHAIRKGETFTGMSVHMMEKDIDAGVVLAQARVKIEPGSTVMSLYEQSHVAGVAALLAAIEKVRARDFSPCPTDTEPSYFSSPTDEEWVEFRNRGGRMI